MDWLARLILALLNGIIGPTVDAALNAPPKPPVAVEEPLAQEPPVTMPLEAE